MSSSIPYDHPSLVLGNIADSRVLQLLQQSAGFQAKTDAAREKMNSLIQMKRSLAMTINELTDLNVEVTDLKAKISELDTEITAAATGFMNTAMAGETGIQQLRTQLYELEPGDPLESPVDFSGSKITRLPLAAESLKLDVQYFSFGSNQEDDTMSSIEKYIRESTANLGARSGEVATTATAQLSRQRQNHQVSGTLIITASCTHRQVAMLEPCLLDTDKSMATWNRLFPQDAFPIHDPEAMKEQSGKTATAGAEAQLSILSGVVYGSAFVGMVHLLQKDLTDSGPTEEQALQLQERLRVGGWLENAAGGFGINNSVMQEVKQFLSTQSISSHVSLVVMGAIPSIASSQLKAGVRSLAKPDAGELEGMLSRLNPSGSTESVNTGAETARAGNQLLEWQSTNIRSILQELGNIDHGSNQVLDVNSMMEAFENYLTVINQDDSTGMPIRFFLKTVSRQQLLQAWIDKYYPPKPTNA
ncbi:MAG: hypothetical protein P0Y53_17795 [Candidatus Pseudobacter hemicellulosilyticus]|uniref:Uncharacterized protein n=1 Tax=Candidatus Pseudobacter hemicellulosilyticus TaxID=3121375 RepID=A0AAJ6BFJ4_9BACT|nr:MAG: hypothetical protein P0Y53_17795 [Pseudobacter sp.]